MKGKGYSYQVIRHAASNCKSPAKSQVCHLRNARVQQVAYLPCTPFLNYFAASHRQITKYGKSISNLMLNEGSNFVYLYSAEPVGVDVHRRLDSLQTPADVIAEFSDAGQGTQAPFEVIGLVRFTLKCKNNCMLIACEDLRAC